MRDLAHSIVPLCHCANRHFNNRNLLKIQPFNLYMRIRCRCRGALWGELLGAGASYCRTVGSHLQNYPHILNPCYDQDPVLRFGINGWKAVQALVWAIFSISWGVVGGRVVLHFHLNDSWWGAAIFACPIIVLFSLLISNLLQTATI